MGMGKIYFQYLQLAIHLDQPIQKRHCPTFCILHPMKISSGKKNLKSKIEFNICSTQNMI